MLVVIMAVGDIPDYLQGDKTIMVGVYENNQRLEGKTFPCLEAAENWVHARWPSIKQVVPTDPPSKIDGHYYDDPEVRWVGVVEKEVPLG